MSSSNKSKIIKTDLMIIGAGPAGASAAILASKYDIDVVIIDENTNGGGQIYRPASGEYKIHDSLKDTSGQNKIGQTKFLKNLIDF